MAVPFPPPPPPHPAQGENPIISMWYCLASGTWTTAITCAYLVGVSHRLGHMGWIDRVLFSIAATVLCDGSEKQSTYFDSMLSSIRTHFTSLWSRTEKVGRLFWILPWCLGKIAKKLQIIPLIWSPWRNSNMCMGTYTPALTEKAAKTVFVIALTKHIRWFRLKV